MPTSPNEDGRPTQGGAAAPVHVMNPSQVTLAPGANVSVVELPDPTLVSDGEANPSTTRVGSLNYGYNGSTWDRIRTVVGDAMAAIGLQSVAAMLYNGATYDRWRGDNTGAARVSLYGKGTVAGDTAVDTSPAGRLITAAGSRFTGGAAENGSVAYTYAEDDVSSFLAVAPFNYNGSTRDAVFNNREVTVLASAARTALVNSADLVNYNSRGVIVTVDITAFTSGGLTCTIKYKDTLSGKYVTLLASAVLAAAATTMLVVFPGVTVAANLAASAPLPRIFRVEMTVNDATSITYSVSANFIN